MRCGWGGLGGGDGGERVGVCWGGGMDDGGGGMRRERGKREDASAFGAMMIAW